MGINYVNITNYLLKINEDYTEELIENTLIECISPLIKESLIDSDNIELIDLCKLILKKYKNFNFKKYQLIYLIGYLDKFINDNLLKPIENRLLIKKPAKENRNKFNRKEYYLNNKDKYNKPRKILTEEEKEKIRINKKKYYLNNKDKYNKNRKPLTEEQKEKIRIKKREYYLNTKEKNPE